MSEADDTLGGGSGNALPIPVLVFSGVCTAIAVFVSGMSIFLHLKNYRKPGLQRMVIRIMVMVPVYGISSLISLFSLNAAFVIDAIRDIYEAFVIYCFFNLLLSYLGGERSLLILLHGREPKHSVFPISLFKKEIDVSDPFVFLFLKRGIIQYVEVKPMLTVATLILKAVGLYREGTFRADSGYLYISIIYNISICLALFCLAEFWLVVGDDLKSFRPMPKFLCVKGILFFSFWQAIVVSILVSAGAIKRLGPYTDLEHISLGLTDTLICFEMPFFAIAHMYAFSHTDYIDRDLMYAARMPMKYAFRDAFGLKDVVEDAKSTLRGEGMDYREFEPAEGFLHQGSGRDRRIKAGLRYADGGKKKYWLPMPADVTERDGTSSRIADRLGANPDDEEVYAPLLENQAEEVIHDGPDLQSRARINAIKEWKGFELSFDDPDPEEDALYEQSRSYLFGDYLYPVIDASSEFAKQSMWDEEERILRDERNAFFIRKSSNKVISGKPHGYGATKHQPPLLSRDSSGSSSAGSSTQVHTRKGAFKGAWMASEHVIDKADNAGPNADVEDGVRLQWTRSKVQKKGSDSPSLQPKSRLAFSRVESDMEPSSSSPSGSSLTARGKQAAVSKLPTDAIDIVVENDFAAQEETSRERRRGEPALRGAGWRKGFTHGAFVPDDKAEAEGIEDLVETTGDVEQHPEDFKEETVVEEAEEAVARASEPPPHAQFTMPNTPPHEENPWA